MCFSFQIISISNESAKLRGLQEAECAFTNLEGCRLFQKAVPLIGDISLPLHR